MSEVLKIPEEPTDIRIALRALLEAQGGRAKYAVFAGNRLAKYLWDNWKNDLHKLGLKWQHLLKSLSRHAGEALEWIMGERSWKNFVEIIMADLEAQATGKSILTERKRKKTLMDFL